MDRIEFIKIAVFAVALTCIAYAVGYFIYGRDGGRIALFATYAVSQLICIIANLSS